MHTQRPVNLDLTTMHFPVMAIASILHRISGIVLFLFVPVLLFLLQQSLASAQSFIDLQDCLSSWWVKVIFLGFFAALFYHLFAGLRHMVMDLGFAESLQAGQISASIVMVLTLIATILIGVWLW